ncbi:MAG TPA: cation-translocating P-type ATPase [Geobacteraceae bacterium]
MTVWHRKTVAEAVAALHSSPTGLAAAEAEQRLAENGRNELQEQPRQSPFTMFLAQFRDFMIVVLIVAAVIAGIMGEWTDTVVIMAIVLLNAVLGFVQEYRAERAMEGLRQMAAPTATVLRDGEPVPVPAALVVPGDVVLLEAGNVVPADVRLIEAIRLTVEEASLTGESVPVQKQTTPLAEENLPLGDRRNMCYKGTTVTGGRGRGIAVATGMATELGRIAALLQAEEGLKTPLQRRLAAFGRKLSVAILAVCAVIFVTGLVRGEPPLLMFLTAVALAVAAIPEALPAVVTIALALGAARLVRKNALVKKLPAVETLGSVTHICSDKTGTLTQNRMTVERIVAVDGDLSGGEPSGFGADTPAGLLLTAMALCIDATRDPEGRLVGDPTETALHAAAAARGYVKEALAGELRFLAELPFDADRRCMTTIHRRGDGVVSFTKGAPESVLERCSRMLIAGGEAAVARARLAAVHEQMSRDGLRVIGLAMRHWETLPTELTPDRVEAELTFLGLVGMVDPPRAEVEEAIRLCRQAGIIPVMITGDHPLTAVAIARRLGILLADDGSGVMTGATLAELPLAAFDAEVERIRVYARVAPEQKLKIVRALQDRGDFVAMTGDGVNDAPALKRADIGIAMGMTGTDVAKETAHLILLDDNFATIVRAVREGRRIFDNIRKFIKYLLTTNSGEVITIACAPLLGLPIPLLPIHILWINLMTDALPALALSVEPAEGDVMARPPRPPRESVFAHGLGLHVVWVGTLIGALVLAVQAWSLHRGDVHWQTMTFTVLCFTQLFHVLAIRSERQSLFTVGVGSNKPLLGAVLIAACLQLAVVYVPFLTRVFRTEPLEARELAVVVGVSALVFVAVELEKLVKRRFVAECA